MEDLKWEKEEDAMICAGTCGVCARWVARLSSVSAFPSWVVRLSHLRPSTKYANAQRPSPHVRSCHACELLCGLLVFLWSFWSGVVF
eukprot:4833069-Prymnesium_polylepis.1